MEPSNMQNFLLLYKGNFKPYQPAGSWSIYNGFEPNELLHSHKKEFVADKLLSYEKAEFKLTELLCIPRR